jgi:hypothetical protein
MKDDESVEKLVILEYCLRNLEPSLAVDGRRVEQWLELEYNVSGKKSAR